MELLRRQNSLFLKEGPALFPLGRGASLDHLLELSLADFKSFLETTERTRAVTHLSPGKPIESQKMKPTTIGSGKWRK